MAKHRVRISKEEQEARRLERMAALEERRRRFEEAERMRLIEEEAKKKKVSVDPMTFVQICKFGFVTDTTPYGRVEISFSAGDVADMCGGKIVEKTYYSQVYQFLLLPMDRMQRYQTLRNSPMYWQLADSFTP